MTNYIKQWWERTKAQTQADNIAKLRDGFYLKEKNGSVWIMHDGVAIDKVHPCTSSDDVVQLLNEARNYAVEYEYGKQEDTLYKVQNGDLAVPKAKIYENIHIAPDKWM